MAWNRKNADSQEWVPPTSGAKRSVPNQPASLAPNMTPKPNSQYRSTEQAKSVMFLSATLMAFLLRVSPDSRQRKPSCMLNTSTAHNTTQRVSTRKLLISLGLGLQRFSLLGGPALQAGGASRTPELAEDAWFARHPGGPGLTQLRSALTWKVLDNWCRRAAVSLTWSELARKERMTRVIDSVTSATCPA